MLTAHNAKTTMIAKGIHATLNHLVESYKYIWWKCGVSLSKNPFETFHGEGLFHRRIGAHLAHLKLAHFRGPSELLLVSPQPAYQLFQ